MAKSATVYSDDSIKASRSEPSSVTVDVSFRILDLEGEARRLRQVADSLKPRILELNRQIDVNRAKASELESQAQALREQFDIPVQRQFHNRKLVPDSIEAI